MFANECVCKCACARERKTDSRQTDRQTGERGDAERACVIDGS